MRRVWQHAAAGWSCCLLGGRIVERLSWKRSGRRLSWDGCRLGWTDDMVVQVREANRVTCSRLPPSMHPALLVPELFTHICAEIRRPEGEYWPFHDRDVARTLFALALTCRAFESIALDALWFQQDQLNNLVRLIPSEAAQSLQPLPYEDTRILLQYSRRIRRLSVPNLGRVGMLTHTTDPIVGGQCRRLAAYAQTALVEVFPNLRELSIDAIGMADQSDVLRLLFVPGLIRIDISSGSFGDSHRTSPCLEILRKSECAAKLAELRIDPAGYRWTDCSREILRLLPSLRNIRELDVLLDYATLHYLQRLPTLHTLHTWMPVSGKHEASPPLRRGGNLFDFQGLRGLVVRCSNSRVDEFVDFADSLHVPALEFLKIALRDSITAPLLLNLVSAIAQRSKASGLEHLCLTNFYNCYEEDTAPREIVSLASLTTALFAFTALKDLILQLPFFLEYDDRLLEEIASAWPNLERLILGYAFSLVDEGLDHALGPAPKATLRGLYSLARRCPRLRELALSFDPAASDLTGDLALASLTDSSLRTIDVCHSPITKDNTLRVAWFLAKTFPNLTSVNTGYEKLLMDLEPEHLARWEVMGRYGKRWRSMEGLIAKIRESEAENWADVLGEDSGEENGLDNEVVPAAPPKRLARWAQRF
ncbi:hypothetical protein MKEN_00482200 [Mycena kentingensis (nom. inval.)]|nr:hypothetical protein MKEN_00482200 [Mycena kentingensis (nom. inval.)]